MGNNPSRRADYRPTYAPKHAYYSERGSRRKRTKDRVPYPQDEDYYPPGYPHFNASQPYAYMGPPLTQFPAPMQSAAYPVIPPVPGPMQHVVIPASMPSIQPSMQMPMPQPSPAPVIPSYPGTSGATPFHGATVIPTPSMAFPQQPSQQHYYQDSESSPDSSSEYMGQGHPYQGQMHPGPIYQEPMQQGPPIPPGQYAARGMQFERPKSLHFSHHPLPEPPKDVFEFSPYIGLVKSLRRPPEETVLRRAATTTAYAPTGYYVAPPTQMQMPRGAQTVREKKPRKGLLRAISNRLTGKSKRDQDKHAPMPMPAPQFVHAAAAPQPLVYPPIYAASSTGDAPLPPLPVMSDPVPSPGPPPPPPPEPVPHHAPPSPAPSAHSRHRSPQSYQRGLRIDLNNALAGLTHLSPHRVHWESKSYPTAFHLLESLRFAGTRPDIAEVIRSCRNPDEVRAVVSQNSPACRPDWEDIVLPIMQDVLYQKFIQHPTLRSLLLSTGDVPLQFCAEQDAFWGDGPLGQGANHLGQCLMRVRDRLRNEGFTVEE